MIRIPRTGEPPAILTKPLAGGPNRGKTELEVVLAAFAAHRAAVEAGTATGRFSFKYNRYSEPAVVARLAELFAGKCAYCETHYAANQPMDVEHFRPKGAVDGDADHPGYYWVAASWSNLLPSCIDCNRQRGQHDLKLRDEDAKLGKETRFPVRGSRVLAPVDPPDDEAAQVTALAAEMPLLVNPVDDDPALFFDYELGAAEGFVIARPGIDPRDAERADASVEVYGLNRSGLVLERREVIRWFDHRISIIDRLTQLAARIERHRATLGDAETDELVRMVDAIVGDEVEALLSMMEPNHQYAGLARGLLRAAAPALDAAGHPIEV